MGKYNFREDLILGEEGERVVVDDLTKKGFNFISDNKNNKYDLLMEKKGKNFTYEVKTDVYCGIYNRIENKVSDSGNMFIEFECRGKNSGVSVSEADVFVYYYKYLGEIWYITTKDLKKLVESNTFRVGIGGDRGSNTKGYLVPRKKVIQHFKVVKVN